MSIVNKIESLLAKTNGTIEPYLNAAVELAIVNYTEEMAEALRSLSKAPEKASTLKPVYTPVPKVTADRNLKVATPYVDILNFIRKNEGENLTFEAIATALGSTPASIKYRIVTMRSKGILRAEGSTKAHKGLQYYISRNPQVLEKLA